MRRHRRLQCATLALLACVVSSVAEEADPLDTIDLDHLLSTPNSYWKGDDGSGGFRGHGRFFSASFNNTYNPGWGSWSGFAYSTVDNTNSASYTNQYAAFSGSGYGGTGVYAVAYDDSYNPDEDRITFRAPVTVHGFYANNTTYGALTVRDGNAFAKKFGGTTGDDPDWFKLTITGQDTDGTVIGSNEFYLADYRFESNSMDYIVSDWTWISLTNLGSTVKSLHFSLSSTDNGMFGMNTPSYFAIDNLRITPTFSSGLGYSDQHWDPAIPAFVGPDGDGQTGGANYRNPGFCAWATAFTNYVPSDIVWSNEFYPDAIWTNAEKALGPASGTNSDVVCLGDLDEGEISSNVPPGEITLAFDSRIINEEGPDFVVFENALGTANAAFCEFGRVEVSSDGVNFARFPAISLRKTPVGQYDEQDPRQIFNLCGKHVNGNGASWGTPFDLDDLSLDPLVTDHTVSLTNIHYVRIVDVPGSGDFYDDRSPSNSVYDVWPTEGTAGADIEALGVLNAPGYHKIQVLQANHGTVHPYGVPNGLVSVHDGSNCTFHASASAGYRLVEMIVDGVSAGTNASYVFNGVVTNHEITARFTPDTHRILQVSSPYGSPYPGIGINDFESGTSIVCSATQYVTNGTTRYKNTGWRGEGDVPGTGTTNAVAITLTNDSSIVWTWTTNYWLAVTAEDGGSVDVSDGWREMGTNVDLTATTNTYFYFAGWTGDTMGDTNAETMSVTMDLARSLTACFDPYLATNGTPYYWLASHRLTNLTFDAEAMRDEDGDGMLAWEEHLAGTIPTNRDSVFRIIGQGVSGGSNYVMWLGGTNGSALPFRVHYTTNFSQGWKLLDGDVQKSSTGTNIWWMLTNRPPANAAYKITVLNGE